MKTIEQIFKEARTADKADREHARSCLRGWYETVRVACGKPVRILAVKGDLPEVDVAGLRTPGTLDIWYGVVLDTSGQLALVTDAASNWIADKGRPAGERHCPEAPGLSHVEPHVLHNPDGWWLWPAVEAEFHAAADAGVAVFHLAAVPREDVAMSPPPPITDRPASEPDVVASIIDEPEGEPDDTASVVQDPPQGSRRKKKRRRAPGGETQE